MERTLSAPGKLFLAGEYAVLWGGTARIAAVGPRGAALVRRRDDREVRLVVEAGRLRGHLTPVGVNWGGPVPQEFRFAARAVSEVIRAHGREALGFSLALAPSATAPDGRKLGLGGSARAAVLAAEAARFILEDKADTLKLALAAHALEQGLKGSGGDVAAIFAGGLVRYRRYAVEALVDASREGRWSSALAEAAPVDLWRVPATQVFLSYVFAGQSASTPEQISRAEVALTGAERERFVADSDTLGEALEKALVKKDFAELRRAVTELRGVLGSVGALENAAAKQVLALAESLGSVGKTSGAGGGDVCVVFSPSAQARQELLDALAARGFHAAATELEPGLRGESAQDPRLAGWL